MAGGNRNPQAVSISCVFFLESYFYESNGSSPFAANALSNNNLPHPSGKESANTPSKGFFSIPNCAIIANILYEYSYNSPIKLMN